jgi:vacuolar-type H+-ATPase subunit I/STV1
MTSLLRDLALEKEDFSSQQEETLICNNSEEKYTALVLTHELLQASHHKTLGEVTILKDTINTLQEDYSEAKKQIERQKEQVLTCQEVEECNADLREECEKHANSFQELQACHSDLEHSLSVNTDYFYIHTHTGYR